MGSLFEWVDRPIEPSSARCLDEYRAGKDVVLEGFAHLPTGLAEFPQVNESYLLQKLEKMGVKVLEFAKVTGQDPPPGANQTATA